VGDFFFHAYGRKTDGQTEREQANRHFFTFASAHKIIV